MVRQPSADPTEPFPTIFRKHDLFQTALTIRCYTQLNVLRPYIDSQINHIKHFIKFPFIIKVIDFIDLPSMFKDETVESSIPNYFEYSSKTLKFQCTLSDYAKNINHCLIEYRRTHQSCWKIGDLWLQCQIIRKRQ